MKVAVIVNRGAGSLSPANDSASLDRIQRAFEASPFQPEIHLVPGAQIQSTAVAAAKSGAEALFAGGGDGTISGMAEIAAQFQLPLGALPLGTRNHFARDLQMPLNLEPAIASLHPNRSTAIDLGDVNGRLFINNSSIGAYPRTVEERDEKKRRGWPKYLAMLVAAIRVFYRLPLIHVRIEFENQSIRRSTPFVFVGNNEYTMNLFSVSLRSSLDRGKLCIYTAHCTGLGCLFRLALNTLAGRLQQSRDFESHHVSEARIIPHQRSPRVAKDGEILRLRSPLHYRIRPKTLTVFLPSQSNA